MTTRFGRKRYNGPLSAGEIAIGMEVARKNAARLLQDAVVLKDLGRYPSACSLAILSIEEMGKWEVLRTLALAKDEREIKVAWKDYRDHRSKNCRWVLASSARPKGAKIDYLYAANRDGWHTGFLDAMKQGGFYTDCVDDREWILPEELFSVGLTRELLAIAAEMLEDKPISSREIEIWIENMGGVENPEDLSSAILSFAAAMDAEGLSNNYSKRLEKILSKNSILS